MRPRDGSQPRKLKVQIEKLRKEWREKRPSSVEKITFETVTGVLPDGRYMVAGAPLQTTGTATITVGQKVAVAWKDGSPQAIVEHSARRAQFFSPPEEDMVVEELFIATDPNTGVKDVFFRNDKQVTPLRLREKNPDDWEGLVMSRVKWGPRGWQFVVMATFTVYFIYNINRTGDRSLGATPAVAELVRVESDFSELSSEVFLSYSSRRVLTKHAAQAATRTTVTVTLEGASCVPSLPNGEDDLEITGSQHRRRVEDTTQTKTVFASEALGTRLLDFALSDRVDENGKPDGDLLLLHSLFPNTFGSGTGEETESYVNFGESDCGFYSPREPSPITRGHDFAKSEDHIILIQVARTDPRLRVLFSTVAPSKSIISVSHTVVGGEPFPADDIQSVVLVGSSQCFNLPGYEPCTSFIPIGFEDPPPVVKDGYIGGDGLRSGLEFISDTSLWDQRIPFYTANPPYSAGLSDPQTFWPSFTSAPMFEGSLAGTDDPPTLLKWAYRFNLFYKTFLQTSGEEFRYEVVKARVADTRGGFVTLVLVVIRTTGASPIETGVFLIDVFNRDSFVLRSVILPFTVLDTGFPVFITLGRRYLLFYLPEDIFGNPVIGRVFLADALTNPATVVSVARDNEDSEEVLGAFLRLTENVGQVAEPDILFSAKETAESPPGKLVRKTGLFVGPDFPQEDRSIRVLKLRRLPEGITPPVIPECGRVTSVDEHVFIVPPTRDLIAFRR